MSDLLQLWREVCERSPALVNPQGKHLIVSESDCVLLGCEIKRACLPPAPPSVVKTLAGPDHKTVTFDASQWQPIETAPKTGCALLLGYENSHGKWRTIRGKWISKEAINEEWDEPEDFDAGWYEVSVEADDAPNCWPTTPTHWMPLPSAPGTAPTPAAQNADHCRCPACRDGVVHASDCAVHNAPALPVGPCDCGVAPAAQSAGQEAVAWAVYSGIGEMRKHSVHSKKDAAVEVASSIKSNTEVRPLYAAPVNVSEQSAGREAGTFAQGLEAAAKWLEKRAADYADEFGGVDPDTGTLEFGSGPHADLKHETHYEWIECAENIRKLAAPVNGGERTPIKPVTYTTKPAESVMGIALRQCGNEDAWRQILAWNPRFEFLASCDYFPVGTVLVMPPRERAADAQQVGGDAESLLREARNVVAEQAHTEYYIDLLQRIDAALSSPAKVGGDEPHSDDIAVDRFTAAMKAKLAKKRAQGRGGWDDERVCSPDDLARMLVEHLPKGDPVDIGNFAMMLFNRPDSGAALCRAADLLDEYAALTSPAKVGGNGLIEQHARDSAELRRLCAARDEARRTAEYWKANHLAGNAEIERLRKLLEVKVGGDEREAFERFARGQTFIKDCQRFDEVEKGSLNEYGHWESQKARHVWLAALEYARAALSADGGEDKRDAERLDWLMQHVCADEIEGIRSLPYGIDMDEYLHLFREAIDAAIAANQARKGE